MSGGMSFQLCTHGLITWAPPKAGSPTENSIIYAIHYMSTKTSF